MLPSRPDLDPPYLHGLNDRQKEAALALDGPVLIIAGAGTGKTRVLTTRLAHLLHTRKALPGQVLAVTFTNKAAQEMKHRVSALLDGAPVEVRSFEGVGVSAVIHTDIDRDGTGQGLNIDATKDLARNTSIPVIASGGVASIADLEKVRDARLEGVIAGRALYDGSIDLSEASAFS